MSMVRFLFVCTVIALAASCSGGGDYVLPNKQAPALWLVEDPQSDGRAYIIGSVHMLPDGLDWITPNIRSAAAQSDRLITEIGDDTAQTAAFDAMASDEAAPPLARRLPARELARAEMLASGAGLTEDDLDRTESWAVAILLTQAQSADLGVTTQNGVEMQLRKLMVGKPMDGLETAKAQLERIDTLPNDVQDNMLRLSLRPTNPRSDFQAMLTVWLTGDLAAMEALMGDGLMADTNLRARLLNDANTRWAQQITTHIRAGKRPLIAIGAAHLLGDLGILALLQAQGMTVTRVQ